MTSGHKLCRLFVWLYFLPDQIPKFVNNYNQIWSPRFYNMISLNTKIQQDFIISIHSLFSNLHSGAKPNTDHFLLLYPASNTDHVELSPPNLLIFSLSLISWKHLHLLNYLSCLLNQPVSIFPHFHEHTIPKLLLLTQKKMLNGYQTSFSFISRYI